MGFLYPVTVCINGTSGLGETSFYHTIIIVQHFCMSMYMIILYLCIGSVHDFMCHVLGYNIVYEVLTRCPVPETQW